MPVIPMNQQMQNLVRQILAAIGEQIESGHINDRISQGHGLDLQSLVEEAAIPVLSAQVDALALEDRLKIEDFLEALVALIEGDDDLSDDDWGDP